MKKFLALTLALVMSLSLVACGSKNEEPKTDDTNGTQVEEPTEGAYKIAMITDYGDITDQSFNQTTYEACKAFAEDNSIEFNYFKPAGDNTADRVAMIDGGRIVEMGDTEELFSNPQSDILKTLITDAKVENHRHKHDSASSDEQTDAPTKEEVK